MASILAVDPTHTIQHRPIEEAGFEAEMFIVKQLLSDEQRSDIAALLRYLADAEPARGLPADIAAAAGRLKLAVEG